MYGQTNGGTCKNKHDDMNINFILPNCYKLKHLDQTRVLDLTKVSINITQLIKGTSNLNRFIHNDL